MVNLVKNDPFLSHVSKLGGNVKATRIIRLTIKRGKINLPQFLKTSINASLNYVNRCATRRGMSYFRQSKHLWKLKLYQCY